MVWLRELDWERSGPYRSWGAAGTPYLENWAGWAEYRRQRRRYESLEDWLSERFRWHRGNCHVVRQDLARELRIGVSLRTVERAVAPLRQALRAEARACVRFETLLGEQLQIDFGAMRMSIGYICSWAHQSGRLQIGISGRLRLNAGGFKLVLRTDRGPELTRDQFEAGLNKDAGCAPMPLSGRPGAPMSIGAGHGQSR
jgi:hypothetical protein